MFVVPSTKSTIFLALVFRPAFQGQAVAYEQAANRLKRRIAQRGHYHVLICVRSISVRIAESIAAG